MKPKLLAVASHPIQYYVPLYRSLTQKQQLELRVVFCREYGVRPTYDRQFGSYIQWDADLLDGYQHSFLRNFSPITSTFNPLHAFNPGVMPEVWRWADVIWINGLLYPTNLLAMIAARAKRAPVLLRSELHPPQIAGASLKNKLKRLFYRQALRGVDGVMTIGSSNRAAYASLGVVEEQMTETPYVVEMNRFRVPVAEREKRRAQRRSLWGLKDTDIAVLYLGKFTARKHPESLLTLDRAKHAGRLVLVMVGSGEMESSVKAEAAKLERAKAIFPGVANQAEIPDIMWASDLFVFPSEREPWGLVLNEAMAAGIPAIVSDEVGAAADLCVHGETCHVYPFGDNESLIKAVDQLAGNSNLRGQMSHATLAHIAGWTPENVARAIERAVWKSLAQSPIAGEFGG
ncbi:MAG: glycosyltransferase family 4 protein [Pyrinomonadaceae bacterium]